MLVSSLSESYKDNFLGIFTEFKNRLGHDFKAFLTLVTQYG